MCPILEGEQRLRLLNFQNNSIALISNLRNLPELIFLDLYNNQIQVCVIDSVGSVLT
jgi:leucine-rich repeat-containing protein 49